MKVGDEVLLKAAMFSSKRIPCTVEMVIGDEHVRVKFRDGVESTVKRERVELAPQKAASA